VRDKIGLFEAASAGTLFLDEIGELAPSLQAKLLRALQEGEIRKVGSERSIRVNPRVVAATNRDLRAAVGEGRFREDLYFRLGAFVITVPPLRDRREEVPLLAEYFLDRYSQETRKARLRITDEALEYLVLFRWPGNVRQLANEMRRIVALAPPGTDLVPAMLSPDILASRRTVDASQPLVGPNEAVVRIDQPLAAAVAQLESIMVKRVLAGSAGHLERAAEQLGVSRKGLFLKRRRLTQRN
jgi:transcriptional regulator with PAS, ATPase and Fis domain